MAWPKRRRPAVALLTFVLLGTSGCLDFDRQTVVFVFPPDSREVRALLVYEGLHVGTKETNEKADKQNLDKAKEDLERLFGREEEFCLGHPLLRVSLVPAIEDTPPDKALKTLLGKHLVIHKGGFYLDKDGKLCGYQTITIRDRDAFVKDFNPLIGERMAGWAKELLNAPSPGDFWDKESLRRIEQAADKHFTWLRMEPGRFSFTLPATPALTNRLRREVLQMNRLAELREQLASLDMETDAAQVRSARLRAVRSLASLLEKDAQFLSELPLSFDQRPDRFTVSLGVGDGEPIRVAVEQDKGGSNRQGEEKLIAHARTLKVPFKTDRTTEGLIAGFLKGKE
jgi:hypothetical protein